MTNETHQSTTDFNKQPPPAPFGTRLKAAREALGLDRKDAAAQLRLNEKVIIMMEKDRYPIDLPVTFIRGYIRAYGKLLQIPEYEIKKAIEPIKPKQSQIDSSLAVAKQPAPVTSGNYFMQFFTYLIILTLAALVGIWWFTHTNGSAPVTTESSLITTPDAINTVNPTPSVVGIESTPTPAPTPTNTAAKPDPQEAGAAAVTAATVLNLTNTQQSPPLENKTTAKKAAPPEDDFADDDVEDEIGG